MSQYPLTKFQQYVVLWLKAFTLICVIISLAIFVMPRPNHENVMTSYDLFAFILPFAHFGLFAILWGILFLFSIGKTKSSAYSPYIQKNYPAIWKKLHPWGDLSHGIGYFPFMFGRYDNGDDEVLNEIRFNEKFRMKILIWPFLLVVGTWALNLSIIILKKIV